MTRVNVIVEGPTEETFVAGPFSSALLPFGVFVRPIIIGVPGHKGGRVNYVRVKKDVVRALTQDRGVYCSTLLDLYGLETGFPGELPGSSDPGHLRAHLIESGILRDIVAQYPELRADVRLIPYIQPHEFEGLLFSHPEALAEGMFRIGLTSQLQAIRAAFDTPEDINDGPRTAPSKRILALDRSYSKQISGVLAAERMGIDTIRQQCPHFNSWFERLAALQPN